MRFKKKHVLFFVWCGVVRTGVYKYPVRITQIVPYFKAYVRDPLIKIKLRICAIFLSIIFVSCVPVTYSPSVQSVHNYFNVSDSIHIVYPYSKFCLLGQNDVIMGFDRDRARSMAEQSSNELLGKMKANYNCDQLFLTDKISESLQNQFDGMINQFYDKKEKGFIFKGLPKKNGYCLVYYVESRLRDWSWWVDLSPHDRGGHSSRCFVFSYLCLIDLRTGEVVYYRYGFAEFVGGWDEKNKCLNEEGFERIISKSLQKVWGGLSRKN